MLERNQTNQTISYIKGDTLLTQQQQSAQPEQQCRKFMKQYREDFLLQNPDEEMVLKSSSRDDMGYTHLKFTQQYRSIPVWQATLMMHLNPDNQLYLVAGDYFPTPVKLDVRAGYSTSEIITAAVKTNPEIASKDFSATKMIYFINDIDPVLVFRLTPKNSLSHGYLVDARTALIVKQLAAVQTQ